MAYMEAPTVCATATLTYGPQPGRKDTRPARAIPLADTAPFRACDGTFTLAPKRESRSRVAIQGPSAITLTTPTRETAVARDGPAAIPCITSPTVSESTKEDVERRLMEPRATLAVPISSLAPITRTMASRPGLIISQTNAEALRQALTSLGCAQSVARQTELPLASRRPIPPALLAKPLLVTTRLPSPYERILVPTT